MLLYFLISFFLFTGCQKLSPPPAGGGASGFTIVATPSVESVDTDGDGLPDEEEYLVGRANSTVTFDAFLKTDSDKDGIPNYLDTDSDGDGILDGSDPYPTDPLDSLGPTFAVTWTSAGSAKLNFSIFYNTREMLTNKSLRKFSNSAIGVSAEVERLLGDEYELRIENTGANTIQSVTFPYEAGKFRFSNDTTDDLIYYPHRLGKATRMKDKNNEWVKEYSGVDSSHVYPGSAFAPLTVIGDDGGARIVASTTFPPKRVIPYWDLKRQYLKFLDPIPPGAQVQTYRVITRFVLGDTTEGRVAWQIALDAYKFRLKTWMASENLDPKTIAPWMKNAHGWQSFGAMNAPDFRNNAIDANWRRFKNVFPWIQVWGQMSNYPSPFYAFPALSLDEPVGCCLGITKMHSRYTSLALLGTAKSLPDFAAMVKSEGGHFGYYSRPRMSCDPTLQGSCEVFPLDSSAFIPGITPAMTNKNYLLTWLAKLETEYGANAHYIDVLACSNWALDPLFIPRMYRENSALLQNASHECQIDYYPSMGLVSGALSLTTENLGGENDLPKSKPTVSMPHFGRYIMDGSHLLLGTSNGDHVYFGQKNAYWAERQAFMLGTKFDIPLGWATEVPNDLNTAMNRLLRQAIESRDLIGWWSKDAIFESNKNIISVLPSTVRISRFRGNDGRTYLTIDNYRSTTFSVSAQVDGKLRTYAIPKDSVTQEPKLVAICPANPVDGPCR